MTQPSPAPDLQKLKSGSLRNQVFDTLRDAILGGMYQPGDGLREITLARDLGVSQNTVREALLMLEQVGLVIRTPNKNTTVTRLSPRDIAERVTLRMTLEPIVCGEAARRLTEQDFNQLQERLAGISRAVERNDHFQAAQADLAFHRAIWECSGCKFLTQVLDQATLPLFAFVSLLRFRRPQVLADVMLPHEEILNAIRAKDQQLIDRTIRRHLLTSYREFVDGNVIALQSLTEGLHDPPAPAQ